MSFQWTQYKGQSGRAGAKYIFLAKLCQLKHFFVLTLLLPMQPLCVTFRECFNPWGNPLSFFRAVNKSSSKPNFGLLCFCCLLFVTHTAFQRKTSELPFKNQAVVSQLYHSC